MQALGWATLNSFWQMAVLWCLFSVSNHFIRLSANAKYRMAVSALFLGFGWFVASAVLYHQNQSSAYAFFQNTVPNSNGLLTACLLSASLAYLSLLMFPAYRLFRNWQFVQAVKKEGLSKAHLNYRLFVKNIAGHLGIKKNVRLVVSDLVHSPITVGYVKPMILLPVAALNNLSTAQVEAILLHELSHIRRYDYLVNFIVTVIHTLLYFNPFVKFFMTVVENERETCCDELVLQFGYDKVGYASALLHLEKTSAQHKVLTLAAAGKQNLLTRIEKIVGMEKKKTFRLVQIVPLAAALFCVLLFNSVLIIQDAKVGTAMSYAGDTVLMPWHLEKSGKRKIIPSLRNELAPADCPEAVAATPTPEIEVEIYNGQALPLEEMPHEEALAELPPANDLLHQVDYNETEGQLTKDEKADVKTAVEATKKVFRALQLKEIDAAIADAMTEREKALLHQAYLHELNKLNWNNVEKNLNANYDALNWDRIKTDLTLAMKQVKMDSLQTVLSQALTELEKVENQLQKAQTKLQCNPVPDASVHEIKEAKITLRQNLDSLRKAARPKKIVQL